MGCPEKMGLLGYIPYNYAFDNPIRFIDPDGMVPGQPGDPGQAVLAEAQKTYNAVASKVSGFFSSISNKASAIGSAIANALKPGTETFEVGSGERRKSGVAITDKKGNGVKERDTAPLENIREVKNEDLQGAMDAVKAVTDKPMKMSEAIEDKRDGSLERVHDQLEEVQDTDEPDAQSNSSQSEQDAGGTYITVYKDTTTNTVQRTDVNGSGKPVKVDTVKTGSSPFFKQP